MGEIFGLTESSDERMQGLKARERRLREAPDGQVSLINPDARSMATSGRGTGVVACNVQTAVDDKHHLNVAHEVTNKVWKTHGLRPRGPAWRSASIPSNREKWWSATSIR
jgi:hypothetical protein